MTCKPKSLAKIVHLGKQVAFWRGAGETIALVPTMGALHEGHLALVRHAKKKAERVVVSIFVNPAQFAPSEDLATYPRDVEGDTRKLAQLGVDLIFTPDATEMYPADFSTRIEVKDLSEGLCGRSRPHFFGGVATVVCKLLLQCLPDFAMFGEKDYQQLHVVTRMVRDLNIPVRIVGVPIVRETDGLAMSSRNAYLTAEDRARAPLLFATIDRIAKELAQGLDVSQPLQEGREALADAGFAVDYLEVRSADDLSPVAGTVSGPARVLVAATLGETRLIDNVAIPRNK